MRVFKPHPRPPESETLGVGLSVLIALPEPPGDSDTSSSLRATALIQRSHSRQDLGSLEAIVSAALGIPSYHLYIGKRIHTYDCLNQPCASHRFSFTGLTHSLSLSQCGHGAERLLREGDGHAIRKFECHVEVAMTGLDRTWGWVLPGLLEA